MWGFILLFRRSTLNPYLVLRNTIGDFILLHDKSFSSPQFGQNPKMRPWMFRRKLSFGIATLQHRHLCCRFIPSHSNVYIFGISFLTCQSPNQFRHHISPRSMAHGNKVYTSLWCSSIFTITFGCPSTLVTVKVVFVGTVTVPCVTPNSLINCRA